MTILLSLAINCLMLVTWNARLSLDGIPEEQLVNATALPAAVYE
jgi:hypothetical protein